MIKTKESGIWCSALMLAGVLLAQAAFGCDDNGDGCGPSNPQPPTVTPEPPTVSPRPKPRPERPEDDKDTPEVVCDTQGGERWLFGIMPSDDRHCPKPRLVTPEGPLGKI